ncbi:MAG: ATP-dependent helicase [Nitrospira sp. LK70]|nr:ATP-dependent helicase [Nitrospira sp. LK70]
MGWNDALTGTAFNIAATNESPLRVMAGPGTGKSFAIKRRIARLLEEGADPSLILAVTFTRNAAASVVDDLNNLDIKGCEDIVAGTLHGFCFGLLSGEEVLALSGRVPRPVVTFTTKQVLQFEASPMLADLVAAGAFGGKRDCSKRIRAFEAAWARLKSEDPGWPADPVDAQFQTALLNWLLFHRAMLIGELVPQAYRYLRDNPACDALSSFDHLIVDEYQDLNRAEQDLIDLLGGNGQTAIVGDIDQSIYRFRHANPEGIAGYGETHPDTHDENLDECRRCPIRVVTIADHLIRRNHLGQNQPRLRPRPGNADGEVHIVQWPSIDDEAQGIADYVSWLVTERDVEPGEILILTPRRLIGYRIRDRIATAGVLVHSFYHEEALEEDDAQRAFAALSLLVDNEDRVALRWWLGHGGSTERVGPYRRLREHCEQSGASPWEAMTALASGQLQLSNTGTLVEKFRELTQLLDSLRDQDLQTVVNTLLPRDLDACRVLREAALLALEQCEDVSDLFDALRTTVTQPEMPEEGDFVRIMSLHKSKGLTSRVVVIAGCIRGLIPFQNFDETPAEQVQVLLEQRRLFYVAITRCTEILVLSSALRLQRNFAFKIGTQIQGAGDPVRAMTSQFIADLGPQAPQPRLGAEWCQAGYV